MGACKQDDVQESKRPKGIFWATATYDHEIYINYLADEAEDSLKYNNLPPACRAVAHSWQPQIAF